jgi:hypothetical protein
MLQGQEKCDSIDNKKQKNRLVLKKEAVYSKFTCEHEVHALNNSPVKSIGGIKKGNPTTVEQKSISICVTNKKVYYQNFLNAFSITTCA